MTPDQITESIERARTLSDGTRMTDERMAEVFDLVKPSPNWKYPIDATVPKTKATDEEITVVVAWYAGGMAEVGSNAAGDAWWVVAPGYYNLIGA